MHVPNLTVDAVTTSRVLRDTGATARRVGLAPTLLTAVASAPH